MLENYDLTRKLDKAAYKPLIEQLVLTLGTLQRQALDAKLPVVVVFEGWDAAGKGDSIAQLAAALDPRGFQMYRIAPPTEEERLYPFLRRFWLRMPARGRINVFDSSWYRRVLVERLDGLSSPHECQQAFHEINEFERQLVDDGAVVIKFWMHISKKEQKRRFRQFEKDPHESWKVGKAEWRRHAQYDELAVLADEMLERTSTSHAPWTVVEATDRRYRRVKVLQTICQTLSETLATRSAAGKTAPGSTAPDTTKPATELPNMPTILDRADLSLSLTPEEYAQQLEPYQERLRDLEFECFRHRLGVIIAYEGWDAAGKGGNIRRVTRNLDPRGYVVVPVAAPAGEEGLHHYLWRFWKHIPKAGHIAIFDRTWYGRVMVERIEGFCTRTEWHRAYQEINEFERSLTNAGWVLVKFWLHISQEEQLRRFEQRRATPYKSYKLTDEDWRNREKWDVYRQAVVDMIERTSTTYAPWTIVESNCKYYARIKALQTITEAIEKALKQRT
jgi:polyphosphate:AMP phosphotransferase